MADGSSSRDSDASDAAARGGDGGVDATTTTDAKGESDGAESGSADTGGGPMTDGAPGDASFGSDAGIEGGGAESGAPTTCGGSMCFVGQACVGGMCQFPGCQGAHVPGDYATVQARSTRSP